MAGGQLAGPLGGDRQDQVLGGGHLGVTLRADRTGGNAVVILILGLIRQPGHGTTHLQIGGAFLGLGPEMADDRHGDNRVTALQVDAAHTDRRP